MGNTIESFNKNLFKQNTPNRWTNTDLPAKGFDFIFAAFLLYKPSHYLVVSVLWKETLWQPVI